MTNFQITTDHLARGKAYWNNQVRRGWRVFSRTTGDTNLQTVLDKISLAREIADKCKTYYPCSRECVGA
jgi:hypothetical protein